MRLPSLAARSDNLLLMLAAAVAALALLPPTAAAGSPCVEANDAEDLRAQPICAAGYITHTTGGCVGRNELGYHTVDSIPACAAKCDERDGCVSFEYRIGGTRCQLSSSCDRLSMTVNADPEDNDWLWYVKESVADIVAEEEANVAELHAELLSEYIAHTTGGCIGRNELGIFTVDSIPACAAKCDERDGCVSFEYHERGTRSKCQLSSSCDRLSLTVNDANSDWLWYLKESAANSVEFLPLGSKCDGYDNAIGGGNSKCESGRCGLKSTLFSTSSFECCESTGYYKVTGRTDGANSAFICRSLPAGTYCGTGYKRVDGICASGKCGDDGLCTKFTDLSACTEDDECQSNACGRGLAEADSPSVCCPSGQAVMSDALGSVCTDTAGEDDACFRDEVCQSSICIDGTCRSGKQREGDACSSDEHCHSGLCTESECAPFPSVDEKNAYYNSLAVCPLTMLETASPAGTARASITVRLDVYGDKTSRAWSSTNPQEGRTNNVDYSGTENLLIGSEVLSELEGCDDGTSIIVQRWEEEICFSYQFVEKSDDGTTASCLQECAGTGHGTKSVSLQTYDEFTTRVTWQPAAVYYFGKTRTCRIEITEAVDKPEVEEEAGGGDSEEAGGDEQQPSSIASPMNADESNPSKEGAKDANSGTDSAGSITSTNEAGLLTDTNGATGSSANFIGLLSVIFVGCMYLLH